MREPAPRYQCYRGVIPVLCYSVDLVQRGIACRSTVNAQANYEKSVFAKTGRTNARGEGKSATLCRSAHVPLRCCDIHSHSCPLLCAHVRWCPIFSAKRLPVFPSALG